MDRNEIPHDPRRLAVPSRASQTISKPMVHSAQTVHLSCVRLALSPNRPKRASTSAMTPSSTNRCVQNGFRGVGRLPILHQHKHHVQMDRNRIPHDTYHLVVPSGASKMIPEPMVRSAEIVHLSCVKISTISKQTKTSFYLSLVT
jgi:hypothetical protein